MAGDVRIFVPLKGLVDVAAEEEHQYYDDAYKVLAKAPRITSGISTNEAGLSLTNRRAPRRISEAELVRMQRDGQSLDFETAPISRESAPAKAGIQDPALGRALDLLKGLAVVQQFRPSL